MMLNSSFESKKKKQKKSCSLIFYFRILQPSTNSTALMGSTIKCDNAIVLFKLCYLIRTRLTLPAKLSKTSANESDVT